jgi:hypothetical protein
MFAWAWPICCSKNNSESKQVFLTNCLEQSCIETNLAEQKACAHRPRAAVVDDQPHPRKQPIMRHRTNHLQSSIVWRFSNRAT